MTPRQKLIIAICALANVADGFDAMAAALVGPRLVHIWGLSPQALGILLSATPLGMIVGAVFLSPFADKYGRRAILILSQILLLTAMFASVFAPNVEVLAILRLIAGVGIGSTIAMVNILGAEHAPLNRRTMAMVLILCGGPVGFLVGGLAAIPLLHFFPWQSVFLAGAIVSLFVFVLILLWLPESPHFLREKQQARTRVKKAPLVEVLQGELLIGTLLLSVVFIMTSTATHFLQQWTPASLVRAGLSVNGGLSGSVVLSAGMIVGMVIFAFTANRWALKPIGVGVMILAFVSATAFAVAPTQLAILLPLAFLAGAFLASSSGAMYAMTAQVFPARVRATGMAVAVGSGRLGSVVGPMVGGALISTGFSRAAYSIILATPFLIAAIALALVPTRATADESPPGDREFT